MQVRKLDFDVVRSSIKNRVSESPQHAMRELQDLQISIYTMCGGGFLGKSAASQPKDFYIDLRVGKLPYSKKAILQAVKVLSIYAEELGLDPNRLDFHSGFHACGIF